MAVEMDFTHVHLSSRYDRDALSLDLDLTDWMQTHPELITLTQVEQEGRAKELRSAGWDSYSIAESDSRDAVCLIWDTSMFRRQWANIRQLVNATAYRMNGVIAVPLYVATVGLQARDGSSLLVSVSYLPERLEGRGNWESVPARWAARKVAWMASVNNWYTLVKGQVATQRPDSVLVVADWNVSLKDGWARDILSDCWQGYQQAWTDYPTEGGVLSGGPVAPAGGPGKGQWDKIITGSLLRGLQPIKEPALLPRKDDLQHRAYTETLDTSAWLDPAPAHGDVHAGEPWWGFGDHLDDEIWA